MTANLANPYLISVMFWMCFFNPFSGFNDEKGVRYKYYNN